LKNYAEKKGLRSGVTSGGCIVIETAGEGALPELYKVMESGILKGTNSTDQKVVWFSS
jgi:pyroglutamyl-peptidase